MSRSRLITAFVCLMSTTLSGYGYVQIERDRGAYLHGVELPIAKTHFSLFQNDRCVGGVETYFERTPDGQDFHLQGDLGSSRTSLKGVLSFNDLGQLIGSETSIKSDGGDLYFGTANANPIRAVVKGSVLQKPLHLEFELPGPVSLVKKKEIALLVHPRGKIFSQENQSAQFMGVLGLKLIKDDKRCEGPETLIIPANVFGFLGAIQPYLQEEKLSW